MLLSISCRGADATDLSWLLHKRPDRFQAFDLGYGRAFVFFSEYSPDCCSACLLLEIDPSGLNDLCKAKDGEFQYVNPRQYLSSSILAAAIARVYGSALKGACPENPAIAEKAHDLEIKITNFSCRLNPVFLEKIFAPLGYSARLEGISRNCWPQPDFTCGNLELAAHATLREVLSHLYVLLPVFDRQAHFWLGEPQLLKFSRHSQGWLESHPEKRLIINEYFAHAPDLKSRIREMFGVAAPRDENSPPALKILRQKAIMDALAASGARTVIDLGCGDGSLLACLSAEGSYDKIAGMDISARNIEFARKRLLACAQSGQGAPEVFIGSLTCRDKRLAGYDAAILSEVIEHFEPERMDGVMLNILAEAAPRALILTTPNRACNARFPSLEDGQMRHPDHRHEFDMEEFSQFSSRHAAACGYEVEITGIGGECSGCGAPTLMGIFRKCE